MKEIKDLIIKHLNSLRDSGELYYSKYSDISSLENIGLTLGAEHLNKILADKELTQTALSPILHIPNWITQFIETLIDNAESKRLLDPCLNRNSFAINSGQNSFKGYCINLQEKDLLTKGFLVNQNIIEVGEPNNLLSKEKEGFDYVISFPPFAMRNKNSSSISKDYSTDLLIECSKYIKEDGKLIFLMSGKFVFDKKIEKALLENGLNVNALFYVPEGSHSPTTSIPSYLVLITKTNSKKTFLAKLSSNHPTNKIISNNFKNSKEGKTISLGSFVDFSQLTSYNAYEKNQGLLKIGQKTGIKPILLRDIAVLKTIKHISPEKLEHSNNSIYLPRVGNSDVVENPSEFNLKSQNYIQVILNEQVNPTYLAKYFNTYLGQLTLESRKVGTAIENLTITSLEEVGS